MGHLLTVAIENGGSFKGRAGQTLLDAALLNGVNMPHDCRSGHCGTCRCEVVVGAVTGGAADNETSVLACQARLVSNVTIAIEETPQAATHTGRLRSLEQLSPDVIEAVIETPRSFEYLPGQYCQFRFAGFPGRYYSPTMSLAGPIDRGAIRLHIRQVPGGRVSQALGKTIKAGHRVKVDGPYGSAFLRTGKTQRLVLVANGTGFAPIWSVALAAVAEMPDREMVVVAGARTREAFYMATGLKRLIAFPRVTVTPVLQRGDSHGGGVRIGSTADFLPRLTSRDIVYAAGSAGMVQAVSDVARTAGASCYADPFAPAAPQQGEAMGGLARFVSRTFGRMLSSSSKQTA
jgi:NAD(P)H-flavin reductase/ferredoxin